MEYCPHCMARNVSGHFCPMCGGDLTWTGQKGRDLPVGTTFTGSNGLRSYWVGAARGRGGFGITYIAMETNSNRRVAIKEYFPIQCALRSGNGVSIQPQSGKSDLFQGGMDSFLKEARMLLAQEDLASVVHVIDFFKANGTAYLVMEYLDGLPLHTYMSRLGGTIPARGLLKKLEPVIQDLGILHQRGILHRDISPDNLMWMPDGTIKLIDFGSARSMENGKSMTVLMKEGFSPVEQYQSKGQGPFTDVYSMAATIYCCITGVLPPSAVHRLEGDTLRSPIEMGANITVDQESAILWALSIQPAARPQTMEVFHESLYRQIPSPGPEPIPQPNILDTIRTTVSKLLSKLRKTASSWLSGNLPFKKELLPVAIGIAAVALSAAVFLGSGSADNSPATSLPVSDPPVVLTAGLPSEADHTAAPTPSPAVETGVRDGYRYEIHDGAYAVLTGYTGEDKVDSMPDDISGVPITDIADRAFAGAPLNDTIYLPKQLEHIGSNVFQGCLGVYFLCAYSSFTMETDSFSGCSLQDVILIGDATAIRWTATGNYRVISEHAETQYGTITQILKDSGLALYATTDQNASVLLDVVNTGSDYTVLQTITSSSGDKLPVRWIDEGALDRLSHKVTIHLPANCLFDASLYGKANWDADTSSQADMWLLTNKIASEINAARKKGAPAIVPSLQLVQAATIRAEELSDLYDWTRPDGTSGFTALDQLDISYNYASNGISKDAPWSSTFSTSVRDEYADYDDDPKGYWTQIGVAYYTETDARGNVYWYDYVFVTV